MSVIFTKGGTAYTIRSYTYPYRPELQLMQVTEKTEGGTLITEDLGTSEDVYVLQFRNLTTTERNNLYAFFKTTMNGAADTFTFTDVDSTTHTARWMDKTFDFQMDFEGRWSGQVTLRFE